MGQISVPVNGRSFTITCDDGQEARIRQLAQYIDAKVAEFVRGLGQVGESRLLLLAALVIADELSDANEALEQGRRRMKAAGIDAVAAAEAAASGVDGIAERIEAIAARLETP